MNPLLDEIKKEIGLLESWIKTTETGGWSTQNLQSMKKRVAELKAIVYDYENQYYIG